MKISIVAPIKMLKYCAASKVQYCLPKLLLEEPRYQAFYQERKQKSDCIILDCKTISWKRQPESLEVIRKALLQVPADIVILPSHALNAAATISIAREYSKALMGPDRKLYGTLEGTSRKDVAECIRTYKSLHLDGYTIPVYIQSLAAGLKGVPLICLEHYTLEPLPEEVFALVTSLPIRLGLEGRFMSDPLPTPPSLTYREEEKHSEVVIANLEEVFNYYDEA